MSDKKLLKFKVAKKAKLKRETAKIWSKRVAPVIVAFLVGGIFSYVIIPAKTTVETVPENVYIDVPIEMPASSVTVTILPSSGLGSLIMEVHDRQTGYFLGDIDIYVNDNLVGNAWVQQLVEPGEYNISFVDTSGGYWSLVQIEVNGIVGDGNITISEGEGINVIAYYQREEPPEQPPEEPPEQPPITYTLTTVASPAEGGTVSGGGNYSANTYATVTATPATGYVFDHWEINLSGSGNPASVFMDGNKTVYAYFSEEGGQPPIHRDEYVNNTGPHIDIGRSPYYDTIWVWLDFWRPKMDGTASYILSPDGDGDVYGYFGITSPAKVRVIYTLTTDADSWTLDTGEVLPERDGHLYFGIFFGNGIDDNTLAGKTAIVYAEVFRNSDKVFDFTLTYTFGNWTVLKETDTTTYYGVPLLSVDWGVI